MQEFKSSLSRYFNREILDIKNWYDTFTVLEDMIIQDPKVGKKVLFIDELPWFDTHKSGFLSALEHFWNAFASRRSDILLIVCDSAASWMINNLIENYGGLYNRVTNTIVVEPYKLHDCELFCRCRGISFNRRQIAEAYMIMGGIPYYFEAMDKMYELNQNIDLLFFEHHAKLENEFYRPYNSLYRHAENHIHIVETLVKSSNGMSRKELILSSGISDGGLTKTLSELESCGLIRRVSSFSKAQEYYILVDFLYSFLLQIY